MEPITGWNLVFYFGNFMADLAIALFAIKSGYLDSKLNKYWAELSPWLNPEDDVVLINKEYKKNYLEPLYKEYRNLIKFKNSFDKYVFKGLILYLFFGGIALQLISLLASIDIINSVFSSAIEIVISGILHIFEEIMELI
ncbi:MAG TPA: hypothetical protein PLQ49_05290 [Methanothrix sp.]|nr:hypothetical protein [Methanothrix sp.]